MNAFIKTIALALLLPATAATLSAQPDYFTNWPAGTSPQEVGKRVAEHFVTSPHQGNGTIFYGEVCHLVRRTHLRSAHPRHRSAATSSSRSSSP